jgi:hypothetical protein
MLRGIFLIAQPPLLGEEGKIRHSNRLGNSPFRPWLSSDAAPRLEIPTYVTVITNCSTKVCSFS